VPRGIQYIVAVVTVVVGGYFAYQHGLYPWLLAGTVGGGSPAAQPEQPAAERGKVVALGRIEPAGGVITIGGPPGDRVERLLVAEGDTVAAGDELAYLSRHEAAKIDVQRAESQLQAAQQSHDAQLAVAEANLQKALLAERVARRRMDEAELESKSLDILRAKLALAKFNVSQMERLAGDADGLVSSVELQRQRLLASQLQTELDVSAAKVEGARKSAQEQVDLAAADVVLARASRDRARDASSLEPLNQAVAAARWKMRQGILRAPQSGTVLRTFLRPGEPTGQKPILQMAGLSRMVCIAEVYETDIRRLRAGQSATVRSKALPDPWNEKGLPGKVATIGRVIATPELRSLDPFARVDRHVIEVRIELTEEGSRIASQFVNLQVDVEFGVQ